MRLASLLLAILLFAGCDSNDERRLDAQFYVGDWSLVSLSDDRGDQTALARLALDDLTIQFDDDGSFDLDADFNDALNSAGQADISTAGTYQAQPAIPSVILTSGGLAAPLRADASSDDRVRLTAPAVIVNALLAGLPFEFEGDATIEIRRL